MTIKQLKEIIRDLPDESEVQAHVEFDGLDCYLDTDLDFVGHFIEEFRFPEIPDGEEKTTLILNCEEL